MNLLLTGGTGFIGSHAAVSLIEAGHTVILYDNLCNSEAAVAERIGRITGKPPELVVGDVRDTELLAATLRQHHVDAVVHFAGLKAVGESVARPIDYYANNVQGTLSLLQAMQGARIQTLVFSSSATVYGEPQRLPIEEQHPRSATNPYGRSKLHIEEMLEDLAHAEPGWRIACLRYFNPVGAHASGLIGERPSGIPNNLMPYIVQVAAGERPELQVFGSDYPTSDGTGVRDYIHVVDLAEGHLAALAWLGGRTGFHAFNLGTGNGYSVLEIIRAFEVASGRQVPHRIVGRRAGDVAAVYADPGKAARELGWSAKLGLEEMCKSSWEAAQK